MGKATITAGGADGSYTVTMDTGKTARDNALVRIIARQGELAAPLADIQAMVDEKLGLEDAAKAAAEAAIDAYVAATRAVPVAAQAIAAAREALAALLATAPAGPYQTPEEKAEIAAAEAAVTAATAAHTTAKAAVKTTLDAYHKAATALVSARRATAEVNLTLEFVKAEQSQLEKDLSYWQNVPVEETLQAWCADLTEDATGAVATLEIPGESALVIIEPKAPAHVPTSHGVLTAREVQTPAQVFVNAAILPGWQKYKPTYRRGIITAINAAADTADVLLEVTDKSSAQKLIINQTPTLEAVPVQYMACNAGAFEVGDRCVVKFTAQDWAQPKVVGFVDNPKSCGAVLFCVPSSSAHRLGYTPPLPNYLGGSAFWAGPYKGAMPASLTPAGDLGQADMHPGTTTWSSPDIRIKHHPVVVSWRGDDHRYSRFNNWNYPTPTWEEGFIVYFGNENQFPDSAYIWVNGFRVYTPVRKIIAAALYRPSPETQPDRVILRICTDQFPLGSNTRQLAFIDCEKAGPDPTLTLWDLCNFPTLVVTASQIGPLTNGPVARYLQQRPHYNRSATKIAAVFDDHENHEMFAATVDAETGELVKFFEPIYTSSVVEDRSDSAGYGAPNPLTVPPNLRHCVSLTVTSTVTETWVSQIIHAADFVGDEPVALYTELTGGRITTVARTYAAANIGSLSGLATGTPTPQSDGDERLAAPGRSVKLVHTLHGLLLEKSYGAIGGSLQNVLGDFNGILLGDLSKNMFAFGVAKTDLTHNTGGASRLVDQTSTIYNPRIEYSFWHQSPGAASLVRLVETMDGGYVTSSTIEPATRNLPALADYGWYQSLCNYESVDSSAVNSSHSESATTTGQSTLPIFPAYYQHGAVDPTGRVGYFGSGQHHQGVEVVLRAETGELLTVPAYAPGAYPVTLMAPVFINTLKARPPAAAP